MEAKPLLEDNRGKLLVYAPNVGTHTERLKAVSTAVEKTARMLNLEFEVVPLKGANAPIYIYYKDGVNEPVPLYCDKESENSTEKVCTTLRSMMFVLSFHPKYSALKKIRREIIRFS
ncbi:MAG: hypothetical protein QXR89_03760 [Candidatus Bathyarchaeia archaeon]